MLVKNLKKINFVSAIYSATAEYQIKENSLIAETDWEYSLFCLKLSILLPITQSHLEPGKNSITKLWLSQ